MKHLHAAVNPVTGEIVTAARVNTLNRFVNQLSFWDSTPPGISTKGKWFFAHGKDCEKKAFEKAYKK